LADRAELLLDLLGLRLHTLALLLVLVVVLNLVALLLLLLVGLEEEFL
jgi:hypothetical protein